MLTTTMVVQSVIAPTRRCRTTSPPLVLDKMALLYRLDCCHHHHHRCEFDRSSRMSDDEFPDVPSEFVESAPVLLQNESKPLSPDDSVPEPPSSFDDDDDDAKVLAVDAFPAPPSDLTTTTTTTTTTKSVAKQPQSVATKTKEKSLDDDVRWRAAQQLVHAADEREKQKKLYAAVKYFAEAIAKLNEIVADSPASSAARAVALRDQIAERRNAVKRLIKASTTTNNAVAADHDDELDVSAFPATPPTIVHSASVNKPTTTTANTTITTNPTSPRASPSASIAAAAAAAKSPRSPRSPAAAPQPPAADNVVVSENNCFACRRPLPKNGDVLVIESRSFHDDCVRCAVCRTKLDESVHESDDGTLYCAVHVPRSQTFEIGGALTMLPTMSKLQMQHAIAMRTNEEPAQRRL
jgi:hypothetical protein